MVISFIGYRGSGKSAVAAALAARLGWDIVDADAEIERAAGRSIRDIFAAEGEPGFRRREREVMVRLLARDRLVLAAGGGAILNDDTRRELRAAGPVIWLRATVPTLAARIAADPQTAERRPNLAGGGTDEIARLLAAREPLYQECATFALETDNRPVSELVAAIGEHLRVEV